MYDFFFLFFLGFDESYFPLSFQTDAILGRFVYDPVLGKERTERERCRLDGKLLNTLIINIYYIH